MSDLQVAQPTPDSAFLKRGGKMKADLSGQNQNFIFKKKKKERKLDVFKSLYHKLIFARVPYSKQRSHMFHWHSQWVSLCVFVCTRVPVYVEQ